MERQGLVNIKGYVRVKNSKEIYPYIFERTDYVCILLGVGDALPISIEQIEYL